MFCNKCGKELEPGTKFCETCGARVELPVEPEKTEAPEQVTEQITEPVAETMPEQIAEPAQQQTSQQANQQVPVQANQQVPEEVEAVPETMPEEPVKKKKSKKKLIAILVAAIVALGGGAAAYFCIPAVRHTIVKLFLGPDAYFEYVVKENVKNGLGEIADIYGEPKDKADLNKEYDYSVKVTVGDGFKEFVREQGGNEAYDVISWVNMLEIGGKAAQDETSSASVDANVSLNGTHIASGKVAVDGSTGEMFVKVPELSSKTVGIDLGEHMTKTPKEMSSEIREMVPEKKVMEKLADKYVEVVLKEFPDVTESRDTVTVGGVSQKLTKFSAEISEEDCENMIIAFLTEAKEDKEVEKIVRSAARLNDYDADDAYDEFVEGAEYAIEDLKEDGLSGVEIEFNMWVNASGKIVGISIEIDGEYIEEPVTIEAYMVRKGKKFATKASIGPLYRYDYEARNSVSGNLVFEAEGELKGKKLVAEGTLRMAGLDILDVNMSDVDAKKLLKENVFKGKIEMSVSKDIVDTLEVSGAPEELTNVLDNAKIVVEGLTEKKEGPFKGVVYFDVNGQSWVTVEANITESKGKKLTMPEADIYHDDYNAAKEYGADFKQVVNNIKASGLPSKYARMLDMYVKYRLN